MAYLGNMAMIVSTIVQNHCSNLALRSHSGCLSTELTSWTLLWKTAIFKYPSKNSCLATRTSNLSMKFLRVKEGGKEKTCENSFSLLPMVPWASSPVICVTLASCARLCAKKEAPEVESGTVPGTRIQGRHRVPVCRNLILCRVLSREEKS